MIAASYFDGQSARRHAVTLDAVNGRLQVSGEGISLWVTPTEISEPLGGAPRTLQLPAGGVVEVTQSPALDELLAHLRHRPGLAVSLQARWHWAALALVVIVAFGLAAYRWGLPLAAEGLAPKVPEALVSQISTQTMEALDAHMLSASKLSAERQARLQTAFASLAAGDAAIRNARLLFRRAEKSGPNAFALPDGTVVLFDELVALSDDDNEILGALAHELGHVHYRHGIRLAIQSSVIGVAAAAWLGDVSSLASMFSTMVLTSNYSREMEWQADDYAAQRFQQLGLPPEKLATLLEKLMASDEGKGRETTDLLASHPDTLARIQRLGGKRH